MRLEFLSFIKRENREPYRFFFPLGLLYGFWGAAVWVLFESSALKIYPSFLHAHLMIGGFISSFAFGFLMTAIPRMTQSVPARWGEILFVAAPLLLMPVVVGFTGPSFLFLAHIASLAGIIIFAARRFLKMQGTPPPAFVFIGIGLGAGLAGEILQLGGAEEFFSAELSYLGRLLYLQAFILSLVIGVGSRLVPALLGWSEMPSEERLRAAASPSSKTAMNPFLFLGALFLGSYILEAYGFFRTGWAVRILVTLFIFARYWKIFRRPNKFSWVSWGLILSAWLILFGMTGSFLFPAVNLHFLHLNFIGGLGGLTLMIATRVTLAHGGFDLGLESRLRSLGFVLFVLVFAALTRLVAGLIPRLFNSHVLYAALLWILALTVWSAAIGWRALKPRKG